MATESTGEPPPRQPDDLRSDLDPDDDWFASEEERNSSKYTSARSYRASSTAPTGISPRFLEENASKLSMQSLNARALSTEVQSYILRGVAAVTLFRGFGSAFGEHGFEAQNFDKSDQVEYLDDFISHDWSSKQSDKFMTLCIVYNGMPAAAFSTAVGVVLGLLQNCQVLPIPSVPAVAGQPPSIAESYGIWAQCICPFVFFVALIWWQQVLHWIRVRLVQRLRVVFLDKYCIDQVDEVKKQAGILGLAGFLRKTERFVVCWTPRYFTRLWCTYEVATWLYLKKPLENVCFIPLSHGKSAFFLATALAFYLIFYASSVFVLGGGYYVMIAMVTGLTLIPYLLHKLRIFIHEISELPQQLRDFSIKNAKCFCCTHNHVHPDDPTILLPCDRILVEHTVRGWFGKDLVKSTLDQSLENFDIKVRALFGDFVLKRAGPTHLPYKYVILYGFAFTFRAIDASASFRDWGADAAAIAVVELLVLVFVTFPCSFNLIFRMVVHIDRCFGIPKQRWKNILVTLLFTPAMFLIIGCLWVVLTYAGATLRWGIFLPAVLAEALLALVLFKAELLENYRHYFRKWSYRMEGASKQHRPGRGSSSDGSMGGELKVVTYGDTVCRTLRVSL